MKMETESKQVGFMAVGNYGTTVHLTNAKKHPRGQLLTKLCASHAEKMYIDDKEGNAVHVGYIVGGEWFTIYAVHAWNG